MKLRFVASLVGWVKWISTFVSKALNSDVVNVVENM